MEGSNRNDIRRRPRMSAAYILGNPFALATISISIVGQGLDVVSQLLTLLLS